MGHLRLKGTCHPGLPFGAVWLGFVLPSVPCQGWANLGKQPLPPAHTQAVIHRQEVSSWRSLPDLQGGLVPMGTVGSRQVRPQLPWQFVGAEQGWQSWGLSTSPCWRQPEADHEWVVQGEPVPLGAFLSWAVVGAPPELWVPQGRVGSHSPTRRGWAACLGRPQCQWGQQVGRSGEQVPVEVLVAD